MSIKNSPLKVIADNIPEELEARPQWVCWRFEKNKNNWAKVPVHPEKDYKIDSTNSDNWMSFSDAVSAYEKKNFAGVGFVLSKDDDYILIDLDKCRRPSDGEISTDAEDIIQRLDSYSELSQSGDGVHVIVKANKPAGKKNDGNGFEIYDEKRFMIMTGHSLMDPPKEINADCQEELDEIYNERFSNATNTCTAGKSSNLKKTLDDKLSEWSNGVKPSGRHQAFLDYTGMGFREGKDKSLALVDLIEFDLTCCDPPKKDMKEIEDVVNWYYKVDDDINDIISNNDFDAVFDPDNIERFMWLPKVRFDKAKKDFKHQFGPRFVSKDFDQAIAEARAARQNREVINNSKLPVIVLNEHQLSTKAQLARQAIISANDPPVYFAQGGEISRILTNEKAKPYAKPFNVEAFKCELSNVATFLMKLKGGFLVPKNPEKDIATYLMEQAFPELPPLAGITEIPYIGSDHRLVSTPGYNPVNRVYYMPGEKLSFLTLKENPTQADAEDAVKYINDEILHDFCFVDHEAKANALAALLTPMLIYSIKGKSQFCVVDATIPGTGKSLFADCISNIISGRSAMMYQVPAIEMEFNKLIHSILIQCSPLIVFDNLDRQLKSEALNMAITAEYFGSRVLGVSTVEGPSAKAFYMATGNNVSLGGDLPRRAFFIKMNAKSAAPYMRTDFKHPRLLEWIRKNRGVIIGNLLTMILAYYQAKNRKPGKKRIGGFEDWSETVGGILEYAGVDGFLETYEETVKKADELSFEWFWFLVYLRREFGDGVFTVSSASESIRNCSGHDSVPIPSDLIGFYSEGGFVFERKMGQKFGFRKNRYHQEGETILQLVKAGKDSVSGIAQWEVQIIKDYSNPKIIVEIEKKSVEVISIDGFRQENG